MDESRIGAEVRSSSNLVGQIFERGWNHESASLTSNGRSNPERRVRESCKSLTFSLGRFKPPHTMTLRLVAMDDDDQFYPIKEKLDGDLLEEATRQVATQESADHLVDELQALNTALCFLCSINADSAEVGRFLKIHPEALLLEGACLLPEDSAHYILEQHVLRCKCQGQCHLNRMRVLHLLDRGFEKYQARRERRSDQAAKFWAVHFEELVQEEHEIRLLRREELNMRNTLVETAVEVRTYQEELDQVYRNKQDSHGNHAKPSALAMLACNRSNHHHHNRTSDDGVENRATVLEYQVGVASVNLRSVEREHANLLQLIREGRRTQFAVLKRAFEGCRRHAICSTSVAPSEPS